MIPGPLEKRASSRLQTRTPAHLQLGPGKELSGAARTPHPEPSSPARHQLQVPHPETLIGGRRSPFAVIARRPRLQLRPTVRAGPGASPEQLHPKPRATSAASEPAGPGPGAAGLQGCGAACKRVQAGAGCAVQAAVLGEGGRQGGPVAIFRAPRQSPARAGGALRETAGPYRKIGGSG